MSIQNPRWEKNKAEKDNRHDPTQNPKALTTHVQGIRQLSFIVNIPKPSCSSSLCFPFLSLPFCSIKQIYGISKDFWLLPSFFQWSCYGLARRSLYSIPCMDHLPFQQCFFVSFHQHSPLFVHV